MTHPLSLLLQCARSQGPARTAQPLRPDLAPMTHPLSCLRSTTNPSRVGFVAFWLAARASRAARVQSERAIRSRCESAEDGQSAKASQIVGFSYPGEAGKPMEIGSRTVGVSCDDRTPVSGPMAWGDE